ncbi:Agno [Bear-associated polyomavirus 1]|nr:Agno [Bear-associated polyomavirus 1]
MSRPSPNSSPWQRAILCFTSSGKGPGARRKQPETGRLGHQPASRFLGLFGDHPLTKVRFLIF